MRIRKEGMKMKNVNGSQMKDQIHDCYYDVFGKVPELEVIIRTVKELPKEIHNLAEQWGWNDTEVRDNVYKWMKERVK
jgi:hypothetical protein